MKADDVEVLDLQSPYQGFFGIDRYRLKHRRFAGGWCGPLVREVFERGHAVACVLYDPGPDVLVLVEQFRIGALAAARSPFVADDASPWLLEIMAGIIEEGETPEAVARREAVEETGCTISDLVPIIRYLVSPGAASETVSLFCGRVDSSEAHAVGGVDGEDEDIRVLKVPADEAFRWLDEGRFVNAMTLLGLYWFRQKHQELRSAWRD